MPTQVIQNARVQWGSGTGDVFTDVRSVSVTYEAEALDETTMGDSTRTHIGGLKSWSVDVEIYGDTTQAMDAYLFPKVGTVRNLRIRASATGIGAANPEYRGNALLESYPILGAAVGELNVKSVTFQSAGTLTRATS
jgi:hypothetical protein